MTFGNRLKGFRKSRNLSQRELGEKIGISETSIGKWENGRVNPAMEQIVALASALSVSCDELLGVTKPQSRTSSLNFFTTAREQTIINRFRTLDDYGKQLVETVCKLESERVMDSSKIMYLKNTVHQLSERYIPHYATPSAAGYSVPLDGEDFEMMLVNSDIPAHADFAVNIQGNSMAPYIYDGDMVFVKKTEELNYGDVGIFSIDGSMYCKQYIPDDYGNLHLISANEELKDTNIYICAESNQEARILGKVLLDKRPPLPKYFTENMEAKQKADS